MDENYEGRTSERLETAPHFYIPDNSNELSLIDKNQKSQESFFNCPEVSPVQTGKASFANNKDET